MHLGSMPGSRGCVGGYCYLSSLVSANGASEKAVCTWHDPVNRVYFSFGPDAASKHGVSAGNLAWVGDSGRHIKSSWLSDKRFFTHLTRQHRCDRLSCTPFGTL